MTVVVVGSIAFDAVKTPFGERERMLGGSASHFALAASFFTDVRVVGPVGDDFGADEIGVLQSHGISTTDVEHVEGGRTFFWRGHYDHDMNIAHTDETQLNVFADFVPKLCEENRSAEMLFLGNIQPELQRQVREEADGARFVALDSMNLWIETARDPLLRVIGMIDCVLLNDAELRMLTGESNLVVAAHRIMEHGPTIVVVKRGEYGALLSTEDRLFFVPAYPLESVYDPTGAGDTFAGGFMGYLAAQDRVDAAAMRRAIVYGSVMASFTVEDFSLKRLTRLSPNDIAERYTAFHDLIRVEP